jgi:peroxiredoxin
VIEGMGATLLVVSPQLAKFAKPMKKKLDLTFELFWDEKNSLATKLGLVFTLPNDLQALYTKFGADLERYNGDDSWTLPMPARFIIDQNRIIRHRQTDPDYTIRPEPNEIVTLLEHFAK